MRFIKILITAQFLQQNSHNKNSNHIFSITRSFNETLLENNYLPLLLTIPLTQLYFNNSNS